MPRIYVSSRYRTPNSQSTSDFTFPIRSGALEFNQHSTAIVDSLCISNVFDSVIAGHNTKLYVRFTDATAASRVDNVVDLAPGDYTLTSLVAELQNKLRAAMPTTGDFVGAVLTVTKIGDSKLQLAIADHHCVEPAGIMVVPGLVLDDVCAWPLSMHTYSCVA